MPPFRRGGSREQDGGVDEGADGGASVESGLRGVPFDDRSGGVALENFNPVGQWRDVDETFSPLDTSGALPDGTQFTTLTNFREALWAHPERFVHNMTEKLLTYALGRGVEYYDQPAIRRIVREAAETDYRFSALLMGVVSSLPFQMRQRQRAVRSRRVDAARLTLTTLTWT